MMTLQVRLHRPHFGFIAGWGHIKGKYRVFIYFWSKLALKSRLCKNTNNAKTEVRFKQLIRDP
jgi:hypothetical protein